MNIVKLRRYKTDIDTDQVSIAIPTEIERKLPKASKMMLEYIEETGKILCTPVM